MSICYNEALRVLIGRLSRSQWVLKLIKISKRVITGSCCKCWLNKYFLTIPIFMDKKNYSLKIVHFFSIYIIDHCVASSSLQDDPSIFVDPSHVQKFYQQMKQGRMKDERGKKGVMKWWYTIVASGLSHNENTIFILW